MGFFKLLFLIHVAFGSIDKRLLLDDPSVFNKRLESLENVVHTLTQSVTNLESKLKIEELKNEAFSQKIEEQSRQIGSSYIRWGRKSCPSPSETVYSGYAAGQEHYYSTRFGGPANMLCFPSDPELSNRTASGSSRIYGVEFGDENNFPKGAVAEDASCSFCRSNNTSISLMIPGRRTCYSGWRKEYEGILASGAYTNKASSYICMDKNPEFTTGGERDDDGQLLFPTTLKCGSLPCPPFHSGMEVFCVVCSK